MRRQIPLHAFSLFCTAAALAQTTQGVIGGQVVDKLSGLPVKGVKITCSPACAGDYPETDSRGLYMFPLISPGTYEIRAEADGYQPQELAEQELAVAGRLEVNFELRPLWDIWSSETGKYSYTKKERLVHFYATDAEKLLPAEVAPADATSTNLGSTLSYVIDSKVLQGLPLRGRDTYALLVALPGVTSDGAIGRGLGIAVNGQRPAASNFLLDGLENNNDLLTGNLTTIAPEGIQEYRISTNNFSAEYGRTSGFIANAITASGGSQWHGYDYVYLKNDVLNARGYRTAPGPGITLGRAPLKQIEQGLGVSGPVVKTKVFFSLSSDVLRLRSYRDPVIEYLPSASFVASTSPGSAAGRLLKSLPAPVSPNGALSVQSILTPPSSLNEYQATPRLDAVALGGAVHLFLRASFSGLDRPDYAWTPYRDFVSPLSQNDAALAAGLIFTSGQKTNEVRASWSRENLHLDRTLSEIPVMETEDQTHPLLPGSPLPYTYRNRTATWQFVDNLTWTKARHIPKIGGSLVWRRIASDLALLQSGQYEFATLNDFRENKPALAFLPFAQPGYPPFRPPDFNRQYRSFQFSAFAQDSFKVRSNLMLSYGVRYENYGAPVNTGAVKDILLQLGAGGDFPQRLKLSSFAPTSSGDQQLYDPDNNNVAARVGFAWSPAGDLVVRGAYGVFYDRPFDNLWQNLADNNFGLGIATAATVDYSDTQAQALARFPSLTPYSVFPKLTLFQPGFRDAYVHSYFFGLEQKLAEGLTLSANLTGSAGRKLIATDLINRDGKLQPADAPRMLPPIDYRSNQGGSNYDALTVTARYRSTSAEAQVSYTWSHAIDNQSDALGGDFFNLGLADLLGGGTSAQPALFTTLFDSRIDRGSADFDQRHNLVAYYYWNLPSLFLSTPVARGFRNWEVGGLAAFRSGFPYTVHTPYLDRAAIPFNRASLNLNAGSVYKHAYFDGGRVLLNKDAFQTPISGTVGGTGRNGFAGPGLYSVDFSLRRAFYPAEGWRVTLRADAFNLMNHANLNNPNSIFGGAGFGVSLYGRKGSSNGFPGSAPLDETPRQIQLSLRVDF